MNKWKLDKTLLREAVVTHKQLFLGTPKISQISRENNCWSLFLITLQAFRLEAYCFFKKGPRGDLHGDSVKFAKSVRTPFYTEQLQWLLRLINLKDCV